MSFSRHGRSFDPIWEEKAGSGIRAHSRPSSASMSLSRISLGGSVSTGARLCFSGHIQNDVMSSCRSSILQRTANRVLTVCLSRGGNPTEPGGSALLRGAPGGRRGGCGGRGQEKTGGQGPGSAPGEVQEPILLRRERDLPRLPVISSENCGSVPRCPRARSRWRAEAWGWR